MRGLRVTGAVALTTIVAAGCSGGTRHVTVRSGLSAAAPTALSGSAPGLTTFGTATATVPADNAVVVVASNPEFSDSSTPPISDAKHDAIRAAVHRLGIDESAVSFAATSILGSSSQVAEIPVDVHKLPRIAHDVADAVGRVVPGSVPSLDFSVKDCSAALGGARAEAIRAATLRARTLADGANVRLGSIVGVAEGDASRGALGGLGLLAPVLNGVQCGEGAVPLLTSPIPQATSLDAKPEVELHEQLTVTFGLDNRASRTVSASGTAEAEAAADTAFVFISPGDGTSISSSSSSDSGGVQVPTTPPPLPDQRDAIVKALAPLHIPASHVEFEQTALGSNGGYIRVEMPAAQVRTSGPRVLSAVKNALRSEQSSVLQSGVAFSSSNCRALVGTALKAAVQDAERRVAALGRATNVNLGPNVGVTDTPAVATDPCNIDDAFSPSSLLLGAYGQGGSQLQSFDAAPRAKVSVSVGVSRAIAK